jgi:hypothetical protein
MLALLVASRRWVAFPGAGRGLVLGPRVGRLLVLGAGGDRRIEEGVGGYAGREKSAAERALVSRPRASRLKCPG